MKRLLSIAALLALAAAKPEMYKETEDFQYSRSSTDEGSKSGFYGAQRGNMGGNYERAHNMDGLAQNQMSGLVRQVEGDLGDGSNTRSGSVYSSANSRGVYGNAGKYDLTNLQGRNFQESDSHSFGDSRSHSSLSSHNSAYTGQSASSLHSSAYNSQSHNSGYSGYQGTKHHGQHAGNLQSIDTVHDTTNSLGYGVGNSQSTSHSSGQHSQSGYQSQSGYDSSLSNQHNSNYGVNPQSRLIIATPVRVYGRPGQRVAIPVGAQIYDASHASTIDQNAINSEAEVLSNADQQHVNYRPTGAGKRYESSYSYRKQWEKHNTSPELVALSVPTENPFPNKNSELYDDSQAQTSNHQSHSSGSHLHAAHSSNAYNYNSNSQASSSSQSAAHHSGSQAQHHTGAAATNSNAYTHKGYNSGSLVDGTNGLENTDLRPRNYQSSYSYHKAWERQGDPYVIQPVGGVPHSGQESQRLTANSNNGYSSHRYGTHYSTGHTSEIDCDCDENGHARVARSLQNNDYQQHQNYQDLGQQTQNHWERLEDLGQQTHNNFENYGQQTQNNWEDLRQQYQRQRESSEHLGQQTQNTWENLGQQTQNNWENLRDRSQNQWDRQQSQDNWENLGQHSQGRWDQLQVGQRQTGMEHHTREAWVNGVKVEDINQQSKLVDGHWINTGHKIHEFEYPWDIHEQQHQSTLGGHETYSPAYNNGQPAIWNDGNVFIPQSQHAIYNRHNTIHQNDKETEDIGQQSHKSWSFDVLDNKKNENSNNDWTQSNDEYNNNNSQNTFSSFGNIWDKINAFEESSTVSSNNTEQENSNTYSNANQNNIDQQTHYSQSSTGYAQSSNKNITNNFSYNSFETASTFLHSVTSSTTTPTPTAPSSTSKPINESQSFGEIGPSDIGRGDIGPEEISDLDLPIYMPVTTPKEKTSKEIDALSLTVQTEKNTTFNNNKTEDHNELQSNVQNQTQSGQSIYNNEHSVFSNYSTSDDLSNSDKEDQHIEFNDLIKTSSSHEIAEKLNENDLSQMINNAQQQFEDFMNFNNKSSEQQPRQETGTLEQETSDFEKHREAGKIEESRNFEQQLGNFEQQTGHFEQNPGSFDQFSDNYEQQTGNFEQQTGNFEQHAGDLEQQQGNYEQTGKFDQHSGKFEQQTGNFEQFTGESEQKTGNFDQQANNLEQHTGNFEQQIGNLKQIPSDSDKNLRNFEHHSNNLEQNTGNSEQQIGNYEHGNIGRETGTTFDKQSNKLYEQSENLNQQSDTVWGQDMQEFMKGPLTQTDHHGHHSNEQYEQTLQQRPDLQISEFQRLNERQRDDFYTETHPSLSNKYKSSEDDKLMKNIKSAQNIENKQMDTAQQTGFWSSVGSKLSNAKNKVTSWFNS